MLDYLAPRVNALNISEDWFKYLSLQVGANDVCELCAAGKLFDRASPYRALIFQYLGDSGYSYGTIHEGRFRDQHQAYLRVCAN